MKPLPEKATSAPARKRLGLWLLCCVIAIFLLLLTALLLARHFVSSPELVKKIQQTVIEKTGVELVFQSIDFSFSPYPTISLQKVAMEAAGRVQLDAAELYLSPALLPLLTGDLQLSRVVLEQPVVSLKLPASSPDEPNPQGNPLVNTMETLTKAFAAVQHSAPDLVLVIRDGRLSAAGPQKLLDAEQLNLKLELFAAELLSSRALLSGDVSSLSVRRNGKLEVLRDIQLDGSVKMQDAGAKILLERLTCVEPGLELNGRLVMEPQVPKITLDLSGKNIDVDSTRQIALSLAGDVELNADIFSYLRGGVVPQIILHSLGRSAAELGELKNLRIEGRLQQGAVSIPQLKLDLTELNGDVLIADGILEGTGLSTQLEGSRGHDGTLKIGLASGNDLFQLELMLNADLAQTKTILTRVVEVPAFTEKLERITSLQGIGAGKLTLGDSLSDINAEVDVTEVNFNAEYQGVPFPFKVTNGQMSFSEKNVSLKAWTGSFGQSKFSSLDCLMEMGDALHLDVSSGSSSLALDELQPWLASFEDMPDELKDLKQVSGRLKLSSAHFQGSTNMPEDWQFAASGSVEDLHMTSPLWPAEIKLAGGSFTLNPEQLSFEKFSTESLDADLTLSGVIKDFSQGIGSLSVVIDGTLGEDTVTQFMSLFELPSDYTVRTPLTLIAAKINWQKEAATSFSGGASVNEGPNLTFDAVYQPGQVLVNKLIVKDRHSDANMALNYAPDLFSMNFSGALHSETLDDLFVEHRFGKSHMEGDFYVEDAGVKKTAPTAEGQLKVTNLVFPLPAGDSLVIEKLVLTADGAQVEADATSLAWRDFTWEPVNATIGFSDGVAQITLKKAKLCGIDSPGVLRISDQELSLDLNIGSKELDVEKSYTCLTDGRVGMTGVMDISSQVKAHGQPDQLVRSMTGPLQMSFSNGTIEQSKLLARTLEVLNVTEIVKGRLPKLDSGGFDYSKLSVQGEFKDGKLLVEKIQMDGETLDVLGYGEIDLEQETVTLELLAAPFKTVDTVVRNIPGVNYLLAGSLVTIPVSVKGSLDDPKVRIMSASSVGGSLLKLGERTIKSPLKLIESITPRREGPVR